MVGFDPADYMLKKYGISSDEIEKIEQMPTYKYFVNYKVTLNNGKILTVKAKVLGAKKDGKYEREN